MSAAITVHYVTLEQVANRQHQSHTQSAFLVLLNNGYFTEHVNVRIVETVVHSL